jgi:hypothetical protein
VAGSRFAGARDEIATAWSAGDHSLFVFRTGEVPARVFQVDLATARRTLWKTIEPADAAGISTIGGLLITPDAKSYVYSYIRTLSDLYLVEGLKCDRGSRDSRLPLPHPVVRILSCAYLMSSFLVSLAVGIFTSVM